MSLLCREEEEETNVCNTMLELLVGITRNTISMCCSGRQAGVDNYGFRFINAPTSNDGGGSSDDWSGAEKATKSRGSRHRKAVEQFWLDTGDTIAEFASSTHAADSLGLQKSSISLCCIGREDGMMIMMPVLMWCTSYMPVCMFAWKCNYISIRLKILATGY